MDQANELLYLLKNRKTTARFKPRADIGTIIPWPLGSEKRIADDLTELFYKYFPRLEREGYKSELSQRILEWNTEVQTYDPDIKKLTEELAQVIALIFTSMLESPIYKFLSSYYESISTRYILGMTRQVTDRTGQLFRLNSLFTYEDKRRWIELVFNEVKRVFNDSLQKINVMLETGVVSGWDSKDFLDGMISIQRQYVKRTIPLVAHFATAMVINSTMKKYMLNIGMTEYVWATMKDERVRGNPLGKYPHAVPSHWLMDEKICKWEDSTVYSDNGVVFKKRSATMPKVHPGMEMNCRCVPVMYWGNITKKVETLK